MFKNISRVVYQTQQKKRKYEMASSLVSPSECLIVTLIVHIALNIAMHIAMHSDRCIILYNRKLCIILHWQ